MSKCVACSPARWILYHVTVNCKGTIPEFCLSCIKKVVIAELRDKDRRIAVPWSSPGRKQINSFNKQLCLIFSPVIAEFFTAFSGFCRLFCFCYGFLSHFLPHLFHLRNTHQNDMDQLLNSLQSSLSRCYPRQFFLQLVLQLCFDTSYTNRRLV